MRDIWLTAYGYTVSCRVSEVSLKLNVSRDIVKEVALEALGKLSNDCDLRLENLSVSRSGFKVQFVPDSPPREISLLQLRSTSKTCSETIDGQRIWGGMFKKVRNYLGLFYLYITKSPEVELSMSAIEIPRNATNKVGLEVTPRAVALSPVCDRKRELYKTLFDEGIDDNDETESKLTSQPTMKNKSKAVSKKMPSKSSSTTHYESKSANDERPLLREKSKDTSTKFRRSLIGMARGDESYVPFGETGGVLTYNPSRIGKRVDGSEYIPEYISTAKEKKSTIGFDSAQYTPSKITSSPLAAKATYIPSDINSNVQSRNSKPVEAVSYKPSQKKTLEVNEYVPASLNTDLSATFSYKPTLKKISRLCGSADKKRSTDAAYEPAGVTDPKLKYCPSQVTALTSQNDDMSEGPLQLRTVRRKRVEGTPEKLDTQKRSRLSKASAPEKCLMPDWMFSRMKENQMSIKNITYTVRDIAELEAAISKLDSLKCLNDDHIRYLFYKLEHEIISVAVGEPQRQRHQLFMSERSSVLNNAIPIKAVSQTQLDLIRTLCLDNFYKKHGFQIFYILQVLLPEVIIRMHMLIHGTTYEESDRLTDMGLVHLNNFTPQQSS